MNRFSLTLQPFKKNPVMVALTENPGREKRIDQIIAGTQGASVFADISYQFLLSGEEEFHVKRIDVYINDVFEPSVYSESKITFPDGNNANRCVFADCYGFVQITLVVYDEEDNSHTYSTEYLSVLVRHNDLNNSIKAMVHYVYTHQESLMLNGESKSRNPADLKQDGQKSLSARLVLAEEIAVLYENSYGYFKANSRFRVDKVPRIDQFDHLQYTTASTIHYISTHPCELRQINGNAGVRIGRAVYQPERTLVERAEFCYDVYENRVVLGFIRAMISSIDEMLAQCEDLLTRIPTSAARSDEYIYSTFFMFEETKITLEKALIRLKDLQVRFLHLWSMYSSVLKIAPELLKTEPPPSHVFLSIPQYNRIFVEIHKWFHYGLYDFSKEVFMLSLIKISSLYERYLLIKWIRYFQERGYVRDGEAKITYPMNMNSKYKNTEFSNAFYFYNSTYRITLYYQPVIYDKPDRCSASHINLMRNTSLSLSGEEGGDYYSPDFLVKAESINYATPTRYLIMDAKFSGLFTVKKYHVKSLVFKYLFSVSPVDSEDVAMGWCLIYGKCKPEERLQSVYDKQLPNQKIKPIAEIIPLMENNTDEGHFNNMDAIMRKFFD